MCCVFNPFPQSIVRFVSFFQLWTKPFMMFDEIDDPKYQSDGETIFARTIIINGQLRAANIAGLS